MKNNLSNTKKKSEELLNVIQEEKQYLDQLYLNMAKNEMDDIQDPHLNPEIDVEIQALDQSTENINKALLETEKMKDELKARKKDTKGKLPSNTEIDYEESLSSHFAKGINFYKILLLLIIGSFAGVIIEMLFCLLKNGYIESRTCTIIGPFNIVYGIGAVCLSIFLYKYRNRGVWLSFIGGFVVGSIVEYFCSYFQELLFGSTSWDYSQFPFNLNGRICLLYSIFWGILGVFWIKDLYPLISKYILKISNKLGKILTISFTVFLIIDYAISGIVVYRWMNRQNDIPAKTSIEQKIDEYYPDEKMEKIYPNLEFK